MPEARSHSRYRLHGWSFHRRRHRAISHKLKCMPSMLAQVCCVTPGRAPSMWGCGHSLLANKTPRQPTIPDNHFDLVVFVSRCCTKHRTPHCRASWPSVKRILKPGWRHVVHLEVPGHYSQLDTWGRIRGDFEIFYNNEPFWRGALSTDFRSVGGRCWL